MDLASTDLLASICVLLSSFFFFGWVGCFSSAQHLVDANASFSAAVIRFQPRWTRPSRCHPVVRHRLRLQLVLDQKLASRALVPLLMNPSQHQPSPAPSYPPDNPYSFSLSLYHRRALHAHLSLAFGR